MEDQTVTVKMAEMGVVGDDPTPEDDPRVLRGHHPARPREAGERAGAHDAACSVTARTPRRESTPTRPFPRSSRASPVRAGGRGSLQALVIGGAQMFALDSERIASVGDQNVAASRAILGRCRIPIVFEDTGRDIRPLCGLRQHDGRHFGEDAASDPRERRGGMSAHDMQLAAFGIPTLAEETFQRVSRAHLRKDGHPHARREADPGVQPPAQTPRCS